MLMNQTVSIQIYAARIRHNINNCQRWTRLPNIFFTPYKSCTMGSLQEPSFSGAEQSIEVDGLLFDFDGKYLGLLGDPEQKVLTK